MIDHMILEGYKKENKALHEMIKVLLSAVDKPLSEAVTIFEEIAGAYESFDPDLVADREEARELRRYESR